MTIFIKCMPPRFMRKCYVKFVTENCIKTIERTKRLNLRSNPIFALTASRRLFSTHGTLHFTFFTPDFRIRTCATSPNMAPVISKKFGIRNTLLSNNPARSACDSPNNRETFSGFSPNYCTILSAGIAMFFIWQRMKVIRCIGMSPDIL